MQRDRRYQYVISVLTGMWMCFYAAGMEVAAGDSTESALNPMTIPEAEATVTTATIPPGFNQFIVFIADGEFPETDGIRAQNLVGGGLA